MTFTTVNMPALRIVENMGVARGVFVRSRWVFGTVGASVQSSGGGAE
jgi:uncharacterized protein YbjQ (UPF0145 family)